MNAPRPKEARVTHFESPLGRWMRGYTLIVLGCVAGVVGYCLLRGIATPGIEFAYVLGGLVLVGLFSVQGLDVGQGQLVIRRPGRRTIIELSDLSEASPVPELVRRSISLWSTRGLYGFIGYGYKKGFGVYRSYVTDSAKAVALRFRSGKKVVVSPESPDAFVAAVIAESNAIAPSTGRAPG